MEVHKEEASFSCMLIPPSRGMSMHAAIMAVLSEMGGILK